MDVEEAVILYNKIPLFQKEKNRLPDINASDVKEKRLAEAIIFLNNLKRERMANG
ncbi:MAG: hypothetical protein COA39_007950 [Sulfurimonas sp.]|nr:hypothetical protein [Sulfurimonas sp.]